MILGGNIGTTRLGKTLADGAFCILDEENRLSVFSEERFSRKRGAGGFSLALSMALGESPERTLATAPLWISTCCEAASDATIELSIPTYERHRVPSHHLSHAISAFSLSSFDRALAVVWDAGGNTINSTPRAWWESQREQHSYYSFSRTGFTKIAEDFSEPFAMGFGEIYRALTLALGFSSHRDSSKAMAIAGMGDHQRFAPLNLFSYFDNQLRSPLCYDESQSEAALLRWLAKSGFPIKQVRPSLIEPHECHRDLAAYVQHEMENAAIQRIRSLCKQTGIWNVCLSGGVALNCVLNERIRTSDDRLSIFIPPAAGDSGQCVGNALYGYYCSKNCFPYIAENTFLGTHVISNAVGPNSFSRRVKLLSASSDDSNSSTIAADIANGAVVGVATSRSEWGPRALGNRSILARPDSFHITERIRREVKGRQSYEPFAVSVLEEDSHMYFDLDVPSPYMLLAPKVHPKHREAIAACVHKDGTCRVQTVSRAAAPFLYSILVSVKTLTGHGVLLNTSLNGRGEPICETVEDIVAYFDRSRLDAIAIEDKYFIADDLDTTLKR